MVDASPPAGAPPEGVPKVIFHYIKSQFFRVLHVDGVIGSRTPNGHIHMTLFSERTALPQRSEHFLTPDGQLGEAEITGREGFVREMDADLMLTREAAESMRDWLTRALSEMDAITADQSK